MMPYWFLVLLLPLVVEAGPVYVRLLPQDCHELYRSGVNTSGVYTIYPSVDSPVEVYCDMSCREDMSRGWTVIQRRMDGTVNFYRPWEQYKNGFGNKSSEYWLGLNNLFRITKNKHYELRVQMEDFEGVKAYAHYSSFSVASEAHDYILHVAGFVNGGAGDSLSAHSGYKFSTFDHDNTPYVCPATYLGGFWYNYCHYTNPNGVYQWGQTNQFASGIVWYYWKGHYYSLKSITMKISPMS